ncbi:MAG TPA: phosphoadenylyl-sulfate reductase [Abditibacteriaceae bacterium]|nr:phosphoadenylyl-sulfate reductase [Abditibacteriaceae bacterium]
MQVLDEAQREDLHHISIGMERSSPQQILLWAMETYRDKLTMGTAFGPEGCCLIDMIARLRDKVGIIPDIFNLDTGYQFVETLELRDRMQEHYDLTIRFVRAEESVEQMEAGFNGPIYGTDPDRCCFLRKVVPLSRAIAGYDAWISSIRREQTPERARTPIIGPDARYKLVKINPLANWTKTQVWDYIHEYDVPTNLLHAQGYPSIGCWPCTRQAAGHEDERAGRWAGTDKRECGLHVGADGEFDRPEREFTAVEAAA